MSIVVACLVVPNWPFAEPLLQYDRTAILKGQIWRLATCHLAHWSASHRFWSVGAFAVLGSLGEVRNRRGFAGCCIAAAVACSLSLLLFWPDVEIYRGMSGIDSALLTWLIVLGFKTRGGPTHSSIYKAALVALLLGFVAKIALEWLTHHSLFVIGDGKEFVSLPGVHAVGGAIGFCMGMLSARPFFRIEHRYN